MRKTDCLILCSIWGATVVLIDTKTPANVFFAVASLVIALAWFVAFMKTKE